jgi:NADH-quinone oxidoreductase subunit K
MNLSVLIVGILGLLGVGVYGLLASRNMIKLIVGMQIMVKGAMLALLVSAQVVGQAEVGESMALTVIVVDTIVAVVGLSLAVQVRRHFGTMDVRAISTLKR